MISRPDLAAEELLSGLQLCAFVPDGEKWRRIDRSDGTLLRRFPELDTDSASLEEVFPFLIEFLKDDAPSASSVAQPGDALRSGPWSQNDCMGLECHLEAIWIRNDRRRVLLIEVLGRGFRHQQEVLQAARSDRLAHERLVKTENALRRAQGQLREANEILEQRVAERTSALLDLNAQLQDTNQKLLDYQEQLRSSTDALLLAEEEERRRIATGLHDDIGQTLAAAKIKLGELVRSASSGKIADQIAVVSGLLDDTIDVSRTLTFDLASPVLYELGLSPAIEDLLQRMKNEHGIETALIASEGTPLISEKVRVFLFQAVKELLHNCVKHAAARHITVSVTRGTGLVEVKVEDDGCGFAPTRSSDIRGFGLFNVRERLEHLGGEFEVRSGVGEGTTVILHAPLADRESRQEGR